jgi:hypothetical protein
MYNSIMTNIVQEHPSVVSKKYILDANDRCDKCQAQALIRVKGLSGQLTFLVEILDEREKLIKDKPVGGI